MRKKQQALIARSGPALNFSWPASFPPKPAGQNLPFNKSMMTMNSKAGKSTLVTKIGASEIA
jgi:hypothetical protein